ncbi:hypothetical protein INR49_015364 [Caranx melampygus]|nr:hypothetical protein INR49_015364 [Caranx melampygus]
MMYTITRGPSKLVTQRRTGPTQQIESKFSDLKLKPTSWLTSNVGPKYSPHVRRECDHVTPRCDLGNDAASIIGHNFAPVAPCCLSACPAAVPCGTVFFHVPLSLVTACYRRASEQVSWRAPPVWLWPLKTAGISPPPKIVFNRLNGKRYHSAATPKTDSPAEGFTPAHEENVRFVYEAWQEVEQKLGDGDGGESTSSQGPVQYTEKTPSAAMKNFVPIDLEEWWAQRFLANIANLS